MDTLTAEIIEAAQNNDLAAVTAIIEFTEPRVKSLAWRTTSEAQHAELREDLMQIGRIAVWESIATFAGTDPAQFVAYIDRQVSGKMTAARQVETRQGVSRSVAADFERALTLAGGDPYEAEKVAQDRNAMGARRMTADMARAARMSWSFPASMETPVGNGEHGYQTIGAYLADTMGIPEELVTADDVNRYQRSVTRQAVHRTLGNMTERRRDILCADFKFANARYFGGEDVPDAELAAQIGITEANLRMTRTKAMRQFRDLYLAGSSAAIAA